MSHSLKADKPKIYSQDDQIYVEGEICFDNMMDLYTQSLPIIKNQSKCLNFNFSKLNKIDSSGLVLLVSWVRCAREEGKEVVYIAAPEFLLNLSRVYGIESILPFAHLQKIKQNKQENKTIWES